MTFADLPSANVPREPGVYVVLRSAVDVPEFLEKSTAGWHTGRNPSVDVEVLRVSWVADAEVIYIGKATNLRTRLSQYRRSGSGGTSHRGGRYIWQLASSPSRLVAWLPTPDENPRVVEQHLIAQFVTDHGARPFANLKD